MGTLKVNIRKVFLDFVINFDVGSESGEVDVNCVDYGTTELVRAECILSEVDETVTGWAPQAYPCTLAGVKPVGATSI